MFGSRSDTDPFQGTSSESAGVQRVPIRRESINDEFKFTRAECDVFIRFESATGKILECIVERIAGRFGREHHGDICWIVGSRGQSFGQCFQACAASASEPSGAATDVDHFEEEGDKSGRIRTGVFWFDIEPSWNYHNPWSFQGNDQLRLMPYCRPLERGENRVQDTDNSNPI